MKINNAMWFLIFFELHHICVFMYICMCACVYIFISVNATNPNSPKSRLMQIFYMLICI